MSLPLMCLAQVVQPGNCFFDGIFLYEAQEIQPGVMLLSGTDINGNHQEFALRKQAGKPGEYVLAQSDENQDAPYNCLYGSRVQYIDKDGMRFLAFYPEEHSLGQAVVLTPDNLEDCTAQQISAYTSLDPMDAVSDWLMNLEYVRHLPSATVERMLAKLQKMRKQTIIESTNQSVLAFASAMGFVSDGE